MMLFPEFSPSSKVWVYTANREMTQDEIQYIENQIDAFMPSWAAHGKDLYGAGVVYKKRFLILVVDESKVYASGCSIDTSVRFVKQIGEKMNLNFFDRLNLIVEKNDMNQMVRMHELGEYVSWNVYNPMITNLEELRHSWLIPVNESPFV